MNHTIVLLPGDGIGPEVIAQSQKVLAAVAKRFSMTLETQEALIGGAAIDATGDPLPPETLALCKKSAAALMGAVGGPKWDALAQNKRPEAGLLRIRKELGLFANLRPANVFPELASLSCLRADLVAKGIDLLVVRELTGDVYFGQPAAEEVRDSLRYAYNTMIYNEEEIRRIAEVAFSIARLRGKKVCSVDKANVLIVSRLWRTVVKEVHKDFPDIELSHMYVDNAAMQMILAPQQFDVILTGNIFGDILSDESAAVAGSLGMLPSASLSGSGAEGNSFGLYEPVHGSAPDIAGQDKANPLATILSTALMLRYSLNAPEAALAVERAVRATLKEGFRTGDLISTGKNTRLVSCSQMGDLVAERIKE